MIPIPIYAMKDFYRKCFRYKKGSTSASGCCSSSSSFSFAPPRLWMFDCMWGIINASIAIAAIYYVWTQMNPLPGSDANYYLAISWLVFIFLAIRYLWAWMFWNYHHYKYALAFCLAPCFVLIMISGTLVGLFAYRQVWVSFSFFIVVFIASIACFGWNGYILWSFCCRPETRCMCHSQHFYYETLTVTKSTTETVSLNHTNHPIQQNHHKKHHNHHHHHYHGNQPCQRPNCGGGGGGSGGSGGSNMYTYTTPNTNQSF